MVNGLAHAAILALMSAKMSGSWAATDRITTDFDRSVTVYAGHENHTTGKALLFLLECVSILALTPSCMTPEQYCQDKAASSGSSFYYSFLFLPPDIRRAITALYAFCREVDDVVDEVREASVAQQKLDWWRHELVQTFAGKARHPVGLELQRLVEPFGLVHGYFDDIIDGMQMDLLQTRYASIEELEKYCYHSAGAVGLIAARLFGYENRATEQYAHDLGMAFQLTNIIRDVKEDSGRNRIYLPQDLLARHGVNEAFLMAGEFNSALHDVLQELADHAEAYYESSLSKLPDVDRWNQRSGLIMSSIYRSLLARIRKHDFNVMDGRISVPNLSRLWIAWKTARRENKRYRRYMKQYAT